MSEPNPAVAAIIAQQLGETNPAAIAQIGQLVQRMGEEAAQALLQATLQVEAQGGVLTANGHRRRTPGGAFLYLARGRLSDPDRAAVFQRNWAKKKKAPAGPPTPPAPPCEWADRLALVQEAQQESGEATTVKITVIGRPGRVVERGDVVLTTLRGGSAPALPKGLPTPPAEPTTYIVLIARKQWAKVAEAIQDPDDVLIIEGYPTLDPQLRGIAVFTLNVTTKKLQSTKRQAQDSGAK